MRFIVKIKNQNYYIKNLDNVQTPNKHEAFLFNGKPERYRNNDEYEFIEVKQNKDQAGPVDFRPITESMCSLLEYKNEKYGNSALEPLKMFSGKCKVGTRIDDKLARIKNGKELKKNDVADLIGYLMLTCVENGWDNFDEFKD